MIVTASERANPAKNAPQNAPVQEVAYLGYPEGRSYLELGISIGSRLLRIGEDPAPVC